jgi:hypothetical protein
MTNKSPRLPRKAFTLPGPPAPPNSPALLPPAPAKQDSFALRVVEGIEDAALVEIKCDAPASKTAVDVMVVLDISGSMSTECKVQDASAKAQKHGFSILDVCKHATRALAATLDADSRLGLITFDNVAELVLPSASVDEDHVSVRRRNQLRRARLLTANHTILSFLKKKRAACDKRAARPRPRARLTGRRPRRSKSSTTCSTASPPGGARTSGAASSSPSTSFVKRVRCPRPSCC